jgi:saccharopepsin
MAGLKHKYSQQHMAGVNAESHMAAALKAPYIADGTHPVPVSNFLNAQCKSPSSQHRVALADRL